MDLRIETSDGSQWLELRSARLEEGGTDYSSQLRVQVAGRIHKRPFWFARTDLREFLDEARWLSRSTDGEATFNHVGLPDYLTLARDASGWWLGGELFHNSDPEQHVRFRFAVPLLATESFLDLMGTLIDQRAPAG